MESATELDMAAADYGFIVASKRRIRSLKAGTSKQRPRQDEPGRCFNVRYSADLAIQVEICLADFLGAFAWPEYSYSKRSASGHCSPHAFAA
jgi:hypothetical protein